jgi:pimeloyl-ACP methyl ester carboxylesterase
MNEEAPMRVTNGEIEIEVAVDGPEDGTPVLLLHGWPDSHRLWRHQVPALTGAGLRTIAPDLRGFGESSRPGEVGAYALPEIFGDVLAVLDHLGVERSHVVGHDWGAFVAWMLATLLPDRVDRLAALSVGHPASYYAAGTPQRRMSWYILLFQFEGVAEQWLSADDWFNYRDVFAHPDPEGTIADLSRPGALTASLNWYRANIPPSSLVDPRPELPPVAVPTLGIWSSDDRFLTEDNMTGSTKFVTGSWRYERLDGVGHWMQLQAPDTVNSLLIDHLAGGG